MANFKIPKSRVATDTWFKTSGTGTESDPYVISSSSTISGEDSGGNVEEVAITTGGKLRVSSMPYTYDIAEGNVLNHEGVSRFGKNPDVNNSTPETLSLIGGLLHYLSVAEQLYVSSSSANDTAAGTGARTVIISGLDSDYEDISETVIMNGTTAVQTVNSYLRVFEVYAETVGTAGVNAGNISVEDSTETYTLLYIPTGQGESHSAHYTVPAGNTLYIEHIEGSENSSKGSAVGIWFREYGKSWRLKWNTVLIDNRFSIDRRLPYKFEEKTDIEMRALAVLSGSRS